MLLEQILSGLILLPVADKLSEPDIINHIIILLLDKDPPSVNPDPPTEPVEILAHFSVPNANNSTPVCIIQRLMYTCIYATVCMYTNVCALM